VRKDAPKKAAAPPRQDVPKKWGGLARKGTRWLDEPGSGPATAAWREAVARSRGEARPYDDDDFEEEVRVERVQPAPAARKARGVKKGAAPPAKETRPRPPRRLPGQVLGEIGKDVAPARATKYAERLGEAARAYERDRYRDALKILRPLLDQVPGSAAVRELNGLTLYRLGRWRDAIKELEAFRGLTGSLDQHPTLADCYRALKRWREVEELWEELREASPSAELVTA
jgi:tetratricopeptide (TPR) repeat protein